jgi:hypothetical protein
MLNILNYKADTFNCKMYYIFKFIFYIATIIVIISIIIIQHEEQTQKKISLKNCFITYHQG